MSNYIFAYHGGKKPENPEEGSKFMARWRAWMEGIEDAIVDPGFPVGMSKTISATGISDDGGANPLSGVTIVKADSIEEALDLAKGCPHLDHGTIEVAEAMEIDMK